MSDKQPLAELNVCSKGDLVAALANIFEHSAWIAEEAAAARPFVGVNALFAEMKAAVERAPAELRLALIKAHPDLAGKTQRAAGLTAESNAEQNSVGLDRLSDAEYDAFERVNNAYRSKFGFPNSAFHISSAFGARPRIRSCAISSEGCRTMQRPR